MEQSDTPRTEKNTGVDFMGRYVPADFARDLERALATATRERDAAIIERDENEGVFKVWRRRCEENDAEIVKLKRERDEARAEVAQLRHALDFYSQPVRYGAPNQQPIPGDQYTTADSAYMNDVCRDGGEIARAALAATEPKP